MRKSNTKAIGEILKEYIDSNSWDSKLKEKSIIDNWKQIMGNVIANRTKKVYIKNKTLFIYVNSSVLREELLRMRQNIMNKINSTVGDNIIEKIVLK